MIKSFFLYQHKTADTGEVFYIGKGSVNRGSFARAYVTKKRSKFWNAIVEKHGLVVEVIELFEAEEDAFTRERQLIAMHGRRSDGGTLCNLTLGGDGHLGLTKSTETIAKLSAALSGDRHPNWGKKLSEETCRKKSEALKASPKNLRGKKLPDWWKERIAKTKIGALNPMFGKTGAAHHGSLKVINTVTGSSYPSGTSAANELGMKVGTLYNMLKGINPNRTNMEFA